MSPSTFAAILDGHIKHVDDAVARIERGEGDKLDLESLRGHLVDILEIIERNSGIEAAADDLYEVASRSVLGSIGERDPQSRARRILRDAASRLKERLVTAKPLLRRSG